MFIGLIERPGSIFADPVLIPPEVEDGYAGWTQSSHRHNSTACPSGAAPPGKSLTRGRAPLVDLTNATTLTACFFRNCTRLTAESHQPDQLPPCCRSRLDDSKGRSLSRAVSQRDFGTSARRPEPTFEGRMVLRLVFDWTGLPFELAYLSIQLL